MAYVSPYNDWDVMAGQGTVALEILEQLEEEAGAHEAAAAPGGSEQQGQQLVVYIPVGGGGLIGGMAAVRAPRCLRE